MAKFSGYFQMALATLGFAEVLRKEQVGPMTYYKTREHPIDEDMIFTNYLGEKEIILSKFVIYVYNF